MLDLVVANAGISAGAGKRRWRAAAQTRAIFATNLDGVLNTVLPAVQAMRAQPAGADGWRGRIAVVASIAAFVAGVGGAGLLRVQGGGGLLDGGDGAAACGGRASR